MNNWDFQNAKAIYYCPTGSVSEHTSAVAVDAGENVVGRAKTVRGIKRLITRFSKLIRAGRVDVVPDKEGSRFERQPDD